MTSSSPMRMVSSFSPFACMMALTETRYRSASPESVSPARTLYLIVTAVGPVVGVPVGIITGMMVIGAEAGVRVRVGVAVTPKPKALKRVVPPSKKKISAQTMTIAAAIPAIMSHRGELVDSSRCAGTRCTMCCLRQGSLGLGREGGGEEGYSSAIRVNVTRSSICIIADVALFAKMLCYNPLALISFT